MTTTPLPINQRSKPQTTSTSVVGHGVLLAVALLLAAFEQTVAETDAAEQLYRRGYPNEVDLEWAVADYNSAHRSDAVAKDYPELNIAEILPAISRAIKQTPGKDRRKLAKLADLKKLVAAGRLPKGSILTFQYDGSNRTPYTSQWGQLSDKFAIILDSGMHENPPAKSEYNEKAFIFGVVIRSHKRTDDAWRELMKSFAEKRQQMKEHRE